MESSKEYEPKMHSAEHILNQTMVRMFGCERSFNNHIEKKKSKCDFHFPGPLTDEQCNKLEQKVNAVIAEGLDVTESFHSYSDALEKFSIKKLPDEKKETIRIIHIGTYDSCPCIGQHVHNTSEIGSFRIISNSWENGVLRIRFKAG